MPSVPTSRTAHHGCSAGQGMPTWGSPVSTLARLGEQLLTDVKAFWKSRLRRASASKLGVRMAELL